MGDIEPEIKNLPSGTTEEGSAGGQGDAPSIDNVREEPTKKAEGSSDADGTAEVFCGGIPKEVTENELRCIFQTCGQIIEFRLPKYPITNQNRGFAFVRYQKKEEAEKAIIKLNGNQIRRRQYMRVTRSIPNCRLFIGNIPKAKPKEELMKEFANRTIGLKDVIIYSNPDDERKNRGFCFLEYGSHKEASLAKRKLSFRDTKIWGCDILVDWADPLQEVNDDVMSKVKILYVKNVSALACEDDLRRIFAPYGRLERVKKIKDFAFIHFAKREDAATALERLHGHELEGVPMNVVWAKPPTDKESRQQTLRAREKRILAQQALKPVRGAVNPFPQPMLNSHPAFEMERGDPYHGRIGFRRISRIFTERDFLPLPPPPQFYALPRKIYI